MPSRRRSPRPTPLSLPFVLLTALLGILMIAGGASRPDVLGQVVVRAAATAALMAAILVADRPNGRMPSMTLGLLVAAAALVLLQLVPLPPAWWSALPGHAPLRQATTGLQPWRPLSIQPSATLNALFSLLVPAATLVLAAAVRPAERKQIAAVLLILIGLSALIGLVQFSGVTFNSPFVNDSPGEVSALLANRNHFALLLALGCVLAPIWSTWNSHRISWRLPVGIGSVILFLLLILASGSRAGLALGLLGTALGIVTARQLVRRLRMPRWVEPVAGAAIVTAMAGFILASVLSGRAQSLDRILTVQAASDMRTRGLPTVLEAVWAYFPSGAGFGTFDTVFRIMEPFALLKPTYFNHAHDDYLEVLIDSGMPGALLLLAGLVWWLVASVRVWRREPSSQVLLGRVGSGILLLILVASAFDYPARTPIIMAVMVLGAIWLEWGVAHAALPSNKPAL